LLPAKRKQEDICRIAPQLSRKIGNLEEILNYQFKRLELLITALKHRSFLEEAGEERTESNERLEFLGDAVLDLIVSESFFRQYPQDDEGTLTMMKSTIVSGSVLMAQARKMDLGSYLLLGGNELNNGGRNRESILEDAFEAVLGAIYLDGGLEPARRYVERFLLQDAESILRQESLKNYKSMLLEYAQSIGKPQPVYSVLEESGPDHNKNYIVEVRLNGEVLGTGSGRSKKQAEQRAAEAGMKSLGKL
jgi:ribonuclease-3